LKGDAYAKSNLRAFWVAEAEAGFSVIGALGRFEASKCR
jgi:hypothetical protein